MPRLLVALLVAALLPLAACAGGSDFDKADVAFATDMIPHHRQAVEMAKLAPTHSENAQVKTLAAQIEKAQAPEIKTMTSWLRDWDQPVPKASDGMEMSGSMPGMQSSEAMDKLNQASGSAFDQQFLTMMIAHHEGAIEMARTEQTYGHAPAAVDLAREIEQSQSKEIETMKELLSGQA